MRIALAFSLLLLAACTPSAPPPTDSRPTPAASSASISASSATRAVSPATYATTFPKDESPLSESGKWVTGGKGFDWAAVVTKDGVAYGTESGHGGYDDSVALLAGDWAADQTAQATVHTVNPGKATEEVELRLRSELSARSCTGYEINFRCGGHNSGYNEIVRWDGPLGKFTYLSQKGGGAADGDVIKATIVGKKITVWRNGEKVNEATDGTFATGNPGVGFFLQGGPEKLNGDFGLSDFSAK